MSRIWIILLIFLSFSCVKSPLGESTSSGRQAAPGSSNNNNNAPGTFTSTVSSVAVVNDQVVLSGNNLTSVNSVRITGPSGFDETLAIESQSPAELVANGLRSISFAVDGIFNLIISNAHGAATFQVSFTIQDGTITSSMLDDMGASVGQVLTFDGTNWVPNDLAGLTYAGNWNGTLNSPDLTGGGSAGEYYIVSIAGTYDLSGGTGTDTWASGDWVVWNSVLNQWEKIDNASGVVTFNGRNGAVTPATNDYTWAQVDKSSSSIADIADVDTTGIVSGKILKWDGANWIIADDDSGGGALAQADSVTDGYITSTDWNTFNNKTTLATGLASQYVKGDHSLGTFAFDVRGTTLSGFSSSAGSINGTDTVLSAFNKLDGNISGKEASITAGTAAQYFRGDKTWQPLTTDYVTEGTNKFYTATQARADIIETASLTNGQTTTAPSSDVVFDELALKQDLITTADDISVNSLTINSQAAVTITPFGTTAGDTGEFRFYELTGNGSNYAGFKAPDSIGSNLIWTLPANDGTSGQVLSTNGSGILSWITGGGGGGTSASTFDVTPQGTGVGQTGEMRYLELAANGTNYVTFKAPDTLAASLSWTLPGNDGSSGQILSTDGSGILSWVAPAGGASLPPATTSQDGYIVQADWNTFNNKQAAITTGTTAQYLKGDLSLGTLATDVRATTLTGFSSTTGVLSPTDTVLTAVNKLDGNIAAKEPTLTAGAATDFYRGDKTWQALNSTAVPEGSNLYFTDLRARTAVIETSSLTNGQTTTAPSSDVVFDQLALKQNILSDTDDISINSITTDSRTAISVNPYGTAAGQTGEFRFYELAANGTNYAGFKSPSSLAANILWTLPANDGTTGQILSTNGAGVLTWVTDAGGAGTSASTFDITPIGTAAGQTGEMKYFELAANGTNYVTFKAPDTLASSLAWTLPGNNGSSGQILSTDGAGTLSWVAPAGGASLPPATTAQDGYLVQADWNTFNNKQAAIDDTSDVAVNSVTSDAQGGLILMPYGTGVGQTGAIRFNELAANGSNFAAFKSADNLATDLTWTLPDSDGSSGQVLSTNGSGVLTWETASGGGGGTNSSTYTMDPIGTSAGQTGELRFSELAANGSNYVTLKAPDTLASTLSWTLPGNNGSSGQILSTDGAGTLSWVAPAGGASLPPANTSQDGYLVQADWNTFNNKQAAITTGTAAQYLKGDLSLGTFATDVRSTVLETASLTNGQITTAPSSDVVFDALALKQNLISAADDLNVNSISTDTQSGVLITPYGTGAGQTGEIQFRELAANGTDYTGFKSANSLSGSVVWTLPSTDGTSGQILSTNGSGVLSWATDTGGGGSSASAFDITPLGTSAGQTGEMRYFELAANGTNYVTFKAPDLLGSTLSWTLPGNNGSSGQILSTDGAGTLSWVAPAGGASLPPANASQDGYITQASWNTFNNKQAAITTGSTAQYLKGDLTLGTFATEVRTSAITGFISGAGTVVAGDSVLSAIQKLDGNVSGKEPTLTAGAGTQYYRGDKTWQTLNTDAVPEGTNKYYTAATARTDLIEAASISNGTTNRSPSSDAVFDALALKQNTLSAASDLTLNSLTTDSMAAIKLNPYGGGAGQTGQFRFYELGGTNYSGFKSADTLAADIIWTLPAADGTSGQMLTTNGSGVLSWATAGGGGGGTDASTFTMTEIDGANTGELRFAENTGTGTNFVAFKAASDISSNVTWTLPATDGASGEVLSTDGSGTLSWSAGGGGGGGGGSAVSLSLKSSNYTVQASDDAAVIVVTGASTITLPAAATAGNGFSTTIKNNNASNTVTIDGNGSETIDGMATIKLYDRYSAVEVVSSGSAWFITYHKGSNSSAGCPTGYVSVPGNGTLGTSDFCVMKYEAKNAGGIPTSTPFGAPWVNITAIDAQNNCENLFEAGFGGTFSLIANDEWQTVARNLESSGSNWSGGSVGTGNLARGYSASIDGVDAYTNTTFANCTGPACLYNTAANTSSSSVSFAFKRKGTLTNGEDVWDLAGNAFEWVDWDSSSAGFDIGPTDTTSASGPRELNSFDGSLTAADLQPANSAYTSTKNAGMWYGPGGGGAAARGGAFEESNVAGYFTLLLANGPSTTDTKTGFRCVYRP